MPFTYNVFTSSLDYYATVSGVCSVVWSAIINKPVSVVADIDDAVTKKHIQNTDTQLDSGVVTVDGSDNVTLNQNSIIPFTSLNTGAIVDTLYLKEGNVGIGTTLPVISGGSFRTLQLGNEMVLQDIVGDQVLLGQNVYHDGVAWKRITADIASAVRLHHGGVYFYGIATGNAGSLIPNMDATDVKMVIFNNGDVGIGTATPTTKLEVNGYTKLGLDAPKIKYKKLTGTTGTTTTTIAHGLTGSKILDVSCVITNTVGAFVPPVYKADSSHISYYSMFWSSINIELESQGSAIDVKSYKILITYEE
jgi:hypothetical protein